MATTVKRSAKEAIPADMQEEATAERHAMLESLSMYSDEMMELLLSEEEVPEDLIHKVIRDANPASGAPRLCSSGPRSRIKVCNCCWTPYALLAQPAGA